MSPYRRNVMVGATALGALLALGWMMLKFAGLPVSIFLTSRIPVHFDTTRADGLSEGSSVTYRGVSVGQVTHTACRSNPRRCDCRQQASPARQPPRRHPLDRLSGGSSMLTLIDEQAKAPIAATRRCLPPMSGWTSCRRSSPSSPPSSSSPPGSSASPTSSST